MGRFVGKMVVGGRLLDEAVGGSIDQDQAEAARLSGRVAVSHQAERLVRSSAGPIHLIAEGGPTLRVELGDSQAVGDLYVAFDFVGVVDEVGALPIFSIHAYSDLRGAGRPDEGRSPGWDLKEEGPGPVLLRFAPIGPDRPRRARSEVS